MDESGPQVKGERAEAVRCAVCCGVRTGVGVFPCVCLGMLSTGAE